MNIIHDAIKLIDEHSDFDDEIISCLASSNGYFYKSPTSFVIANYDKDKKDLLVHFVVGNLKELLELIKFTPETITFEKNGKEKTYRYSHFIKKCNSFS